MFSHADVPRWNLRHQYYGRQGRTPSLQLQHTPQFLIQDIAIWLENSMKVLRILTAKESASHGRTKNIQESREDENQYKHLASVITNPVAQKHLYELGDLQESGFVLLWGFMVFFHLLIQDDTFCHRLGRFFTLWLSRGCTSLCAFVLMKQPQYCSLFLQTYIENVSTKIQNDVLS